MFSDFERVQKEKLKKVNQIVQGLEKKEAKKKGEDVSSDEEDEFGNIGVGGGEV